MTFGELKAQIRERASDQHIDPILNSWYDRILGWFSEPKPEHDGSKDQMTSGERTRRAQHRLVTQHIVSEMVVNPYYDEDAAKDILDKI